MKTFKVLIPLLFLGFILSSGIVKEDFIGKWTVVKIVVKNGLRESPRADDVPYLNFRADGIIEFGEGKKKPKLGEWDYDPEHKKMYISDKPEKQEEVNVKKLTKKKLVIQIGNRGMTIHLIRAN
jgi:hypothetical protein